MIRREALLAGAVAALAAVAAPKLARARVLNGFDLSAALVPPAAIEAGDPPRDGIPAIDQPRFVDAGRARLADADRILGIARNGIARAYPVRILNWHEIVNDIQSPGKFFSTTSVFSAFRRFRARFMAC